jgi:hypothetical protein
MSGFRDLVYRDLAGRVEGLTLTVDRDLYLKNRLEILVRVTALTDAVEADLMNRNEAGKMLDAYIDDLRHPTEQVDTGEVRF